MRVVKASPCNWLRLTELQPLTIQNETKGRVSQADDLFGMAAERFRVGLGARVDDLVIRGVNAARHVGWQEQQLVLDFLRVQRFDDCDFAEFHRRPAVRPNFRGIRD